ncbi:MAG: hypothetical protein H0V46_08830 [Sphingomonas sp.]|nr:hypothetical protein [Sphingomonas sp.]
MQLHPVAAVPLIALAVALFVATLSSIFEYFAAEKSIITGAELFRLIFTYTLILAVLVGAVLAPLVWFSSRFWPCRRLWWFIVLGAVLGPLPVVLLLNFEVQTQALITFTLAGVLAAVLWWTLVERPRLTSNHIV